MVKKITYTEELKKLKEYIKSESNEDAKRPLLYPLFKKLFNNKFKCESDACGSDIYIEGNILVEAKTDFYDWMEGFYQGLHYSKKFGLAYNMLIVIAHKFVGIWKVNKLPEFAAILSHTADANLPPTKIGKENAKKTTIANRKEIQQSAIYWLEPKDLSGSFFKGEGKSLEYEIFEIFNILKNNDSERIQINTHNFIQSIEYFKKFFEDPIDAIHCFYAIVAYWEISSTVATNDYMDTFSVIGFKGHKQSEQVKINPKYFSELKKYIESHYIFTNEGSGLTVDYYFSRFDEALAAIDPEYVKQHGIFFTDSNLGKFALWFASQKITEKIGEDYIVFDPAAGSGNLISSWRMKLRHKIISELQPDLLRTVERRMRIDPWHIETGFTIIPKTSERKGLNFIDKSTEEYFGIIEKALLEKNLLINKPLAFLLNPPYKNTDENEEIRLEKESDYKTHQSIIEITGKDAVKERYLAFLGQILNICRLQNSIKGITGHLVMIFTPTSWLIPRPTYKAFRQVWDKYFEYLDGFLTTSNEFFKIGGKWPLGFTIWKYNYNEKRTNEIRIYDYTKFKKEDITINWENNIEIINQILNESLIGTKKISFNNSRGDIREFLPKLRKNESLITQPRYNMYRNLLKEEQGKQIISGFALRDHRHKTYHVPYGFNDGEFVGFMEDNSPIRLRQDTCRRMTNKPDRVWFMLMSSFSKINLSQVHSGAANSRSFCTYDYKSAKVLFTWFTISKSMIGNYPLWANQYDIWQPKIKQKTADYFYALSFAFVLSENRCVVTKFEKDNPVAGAPEIFVDNPLCPANPESFWSLMLENQVKPEHGIAYQLVNKIKELYKIWNFNYCKGQFLYEVGLKSEPYFNFFDYKDFLTPFSGLIQIKKYAEQLGLSDLLNIFEEINAETKTIKDEFYRILVDEFQYFD
jgi:hypothetical protein